MQEYIPTGVAIWKVNNIITKTGKKTLMHIIHKQSYEVFKETKWINNALFKTGRIRKNCGTYIICL